MYAFFFSLSLLPFLLCSGDTKYSAAGAEACATCGASSWTSGGDTNTRTSCSACPSGYSCDGSHTRLVCPAGKSAAAGVGACSNCGEDNRYSGSGAASCSACGVGSRTAGGSATRRETCGPCPAGSSCNGHNAASPCAVGMFSAASASTCSECNDDTKYADVLGTADKCKTCAAGSYTTGGSSKRRSACTTCPPGKSCDGSSVTPLCSNGKFSAGALEKCAACGDVKLYSENGATSCITCNAGSFTSGNTETTRSSCVSCNLGYKCVGDGKMTSCGVSNLYTDARGMSSCKTCPAEAFTGGGVSSSTRTTCTTCKGGDSCDGSSTVTPCEAGTFSSFGSAGCTNCGSPSKYSGSGQASCATCGAGSYTLCDAGVACTDKTRTRCDPCPVGSVCDSGGRTQCSAGTFSAAVGSTVCQECGNDAQWSDAGAAGCSTCAPGFRTTGGTATTRSACEACPTGHYCDGNTVAMPCPVGTANPSLKQSALSSCVACGKDTDYSSSGATSCSACIAGSYTSGGAADGARRTACDSCPAGSSCDGTSTATPCAKGRYSGGGSDTCSECGTDSTYTDAVGQGSCETCLPGSFTSGGSSTARIKCEACAGGFYCPDGSSAHSACDAGKYSPKGQVSCSNCGADIKYSSGGAPACSSCAPRSYTSGGSSVTRTTCSACPPGHFCDGSSGTEKPTFCSPGPCRCSAGTFAGASEIVCASCGFGTSMREKERERKKMKIILQRQELVRV